MKSFKQKIWTIGPLYFNIGCVPNKKFMDYNWRIIIDCKVFNLMFTIKSRNLD
jgi:hypothetical protein